MTTTAPRRGRGGDDMCVWRECIWRTRQTAGVCKSCFKVPSIRNGPFVRWNGFKVLLRNGKKSTQRMCWDVNMFPFLSGWGQAFYWGFISIQCCPPLNTSQALNHLADHFLRLLLQPHINSHCKANKWATQTDVGLHSSPFFFLNKNVCNPLWCNLMIIVGC